MSSGRSWRRRISARSRAAVLASVAMLAVLAAATVIAAPGAATAASDRSTATMQGVAARGDQEKPVSPGDAINSSLKSLDESGATQSIDQVFEQISGDGAVSWRDILTEIISGKGLDLGRIANAALRSAAADLLVSSKVMGRIILIGVVIACLEILTETIAPSGSGKIAMWASHLALIVLAILSFNDVLRIARSAMDLLRTSFFAFIPALTSLSLVSGAPVAASLLHPLVFGTGTVVSVFVVDVGFPLIYTSVALDMAGALGGGDRASGVAGMLRQVAFLGIGVLTALFVGAVTGQRAAAGFADGMAYRTAKYLSSTFIPVAGKAIGDTMDMFVLSTTTLREALGIVGVIALVLAVFSPVLQIFSCLLVWKVSSAVLGPLCGADVRKSLRAMSDGIALTAMVTFVTCFCFVICVSLVSHAVRPF